MTLHPISKAIKSRALRSESVISMPYTARNISLSVL